MFLKTKSYSNRLIFDEKGFNQIVFELRKAGFEKVLIKIPENLYDNFAQKIFSPSEFLETKYNFVAVILAAEKMDGELIKILFVNNANTITKFDDTDIPSSHSSVTKFFVQSKDPVRIPGLLYFVRSMLRRNSQRKPSEAAFQNGLYIFSSLYLGAVAALATSASAAGVDNVLGFISNNFLLAVLLPIVLIVYVFTYIIYPGGLYIAPFEHPIPSFFRRLYVGDLKNNLLASFLMWVIKAAVTSILLGLAVNIIWIFLETPLRSYIDANF